MYALPNKPQHKLIVKVRGGISQKLDNFSSAAATASATGGDNSGSSNTFGSHLATSPSLVSSPSTSPPFKSSLAKHSATSSNSSPLSRHIDDAGFNAELSHLPQPVFHTINRSGNKQKSSSNYQHRAQKQLITPEHNEMIKYVQQSWKGVERDYKKSVNNFIINLDLNGSSDHLSSANLKQKQTDAKKKTTTASTPLLLSGSYHHTSGARDSNSSRQDSFQPFDLEAFWGNRILKRLTEEL